ncbi:MAG: hypothetical protein AAB610_02525 [Patescibacteria group bacterium]
MSNTLFLTRTADLKEVPIGYTWQSKPMKAGLWRLMLYAISSGDWNPVHINPFTAWLYKSNLGGLTYCADLVLAITKAGFQRMIKFKEQPETIATGYENVKFDGPINVGMKFYYRFTLESRELRGRGNAKCTWKFEVIEYKTDKVLYSGQWVAWYMLVKRSVQGQIVSGEHQLVKLGLEYVRSRYQTACVYTKLAFEYTMTACGLLLLAALPFSWLFYRPMNDYCYPFAP